MMKTKPKKTEIGPIAKKVIAGLQKAANQKVVDIAELREAKIHAQDLDNTLISDKALAHLDPLHGIYVYAQNKMSVIIEQLSALPPMTKISNACEDAQDEYLPDGPPVSPLSKSYFSSWAFFDLCAGIKKETFGTVAIEMCRYLKVDPTLITVFEFMQNSRMGFYVHEGFSGKFTKIRELVTEDEFNVIIPSGYVGRKGEMILARVLPEPFPELNYGYSVVFTTPYVISEMQGGRISFANPEKWIAYFERTQRKTKIKDIKRSYQMLMKYGLNRNYWNEYIFEAFVNYDSKMILLAGFPDDPVSRPHSAENSERF
jgi:hypothetical protein